MSKINSIKRIEKELEFFNKDTPENCSAGPEKGDLFHWTGSIFGPINTPYEGGVFNLDIIFSQNHPIKPPKVKFTTRIFHPNINKQGSICLDILKDKWTPAITITSLLLSICSLLSDPNPDDPLNHEAAMIFKINYNEYCHLATKLTKQYAY